MTRDQIRAVFGTHGTTEPTGEGLWFVLGPGGLIQSLTVSVYERPRYGHPLAGKLVIGGVGGPSLPPAGLYLPLARLLAAVGVAEALCRDGDDAVRVTAATPALTAYRATLTNPDRSTT